MTARPLVLYPDPRLRARIPAVAVFDAALRAVAEDVCDTLVAVSAIGLTGPHLGHAVRITAIRHDIAAAPLVYVNPEVVSASSETTRHREGSVSMPGVDAEVERPARVRVRYHDLDGTARETELDGFPAACLQHEIDQLDGLFWIERLSRLRRERILSRYAKVQRETGRG